MPNDLKINPAFLAELAQRNDDVLNNYPLKEEPYDFSFIISGVEYSFSYNGNTWKWDYKPVKWIEAMLIYNLMFG